MSLSRFHFARVFEKYRGWCIFIGAFLIVFSVSLLILWEVFYLLAGAILASCTLASITALLLSKTTDTLIRGLRQGNLLKESDNFCVMSWIPIFMTASLMFICFPGYVGTVSRKADNCVLSNMQKLKFHLQEFANQNSGLYPEQINDEFEAYFPGAHDPYGALMNPYTGVWRWPEIGIVKDINQARKENLAKLKSGTIEYSPIRDQYGKVSSYAIRGGGRWNRALSPDYSGKGTLILSNDKEL